MGAAWAFGVAVESAGVLAAGEGLRMKRASRFFMGLASLN